ncbi:hypothetical protein B0H34DRAFT_852391 [Crassisporium funariophilum]|nr:hypothetical protein B0H34DRAFT_852391 [Crassisporium funariophilum]
MNVCPFIPSYHLGSTRSVQMPETQLDKGLSRAQGKRKTTYPRNHPTENPKPPKRTKAEIQLAAKERKDSEHAKKIAAEAKKMQKLLEAEEKRKLSALRIASVEDTVQCSQKERQPRSERPDLKTMEMYREWLQQQKEVEIEPIASEDEEIEPIASEDEEVDELAGDNMHINHLQFPPESTVDTDSDRARLGLSKYEDEGDDAYKPSAQEDNDDNGDSDGNASEDSMVLLHKNRQKRLAKKKKEVGKLQAEVQVHRQVAPTVYARPNAQLLNRDKGEQGKKKKPSGKAAEIGGLHSNWKQQAQVQPTAPSASAAVRPTAPPLPAKSHTNTVGDGDNLDPTEKVDGRGGETVVDKDEALLEVVKQSKEASAGAKRYHKGGTKGMGIKLNTADISAVKCGASACRPAKPCYTNNHLPFENAARDLHTWHDAVLPAIIDWARTLKEPFAVSSHPDLPEVVEYLWSEEFPKIPANDAVHAVNDLKDLSFVYRDPHAKVEFDRINLIVFAVHQQVITKTDRFYGFGMGALLLCAAALWRTGNAPTKDTKRSFVCNAWAAQTAAHYKVICKLSERVWHEIHHASMSAIESIDVDATADDSGVEDPKDIVQLSKSSEGEGST